MMARTALSSKASKWSFLLISASAFARNSPVFVQKALELCINHPISPICNVSDLGANGESSHKIVGKRERKTRVIQSII